MRQKEKEFLSSLTTFNGIYLSGFYIKNEATVTALSLLFEKVHLPNQLELVIEFAKKNIISPENIMPGWDVNIESIEEKDSQLDPFEGLTEIQKLTVKRYLLFSLDFCIQNQELFPTVFTTDMLKNSRALNVELIKKGKDGGLNTYQVELAPLIVSLDEFSKISNKLNEGYIPIIGQEKIYNDKSSIFNNNKEVASILAMKSIEMLTPSFKSAKPEDILEAREKLKDHLPPFWTSMLKLSTDAKKIIKDSSSTNEAINECQNIVDILVRPALVDLVLKIEKERRNWFYKIVSPVANTVKLLIGNPSLNQAALIRSSLALATEMTSEYIQNKQKIEDLKTDSGLTYLLKVHTQLTKKSRRL